MIRKDFIINKAINYLTKVIDPIATDKPRRKFLCQIFEVTLLSSSMVVMKFSHLIHDDCFDIFFCLKRFLNHLTNPRANLPKVARTYREQMARYTEPDTTLTIDMTDIAKP